jgi:hypothetical protein
LSIFLIYFSETHVLAAKKEKEIQKLKEAFNIRDDHIEGEAFDPHMRQRRREERKVVF